jgi:lysophospholipase L1-like esterase
LGFSVFVLSVAAMLVVAVELVVAAELAARWWLRRGGYYVFPPGLRLRLYPDRQVFPELEPVVRFEVNGDGERGSEVPRTRRGETLFRVLVVGGSQPEGYFLDQDTSWPGALQRLLEEPGPLQRLGATRAHVGNIGRSGVGSEGLDLILERVLPRYSRLQAIVILVGASDFLRWLEQGAPPCPPTPVPASEVFRCHPEGRFGWTLRKLAALELLLRIRRRWFRPVEVHERAGTWVGKARMMRARARVIRATAGDPGPMLDHFGIHLRRAIQKAQAHADRVILVRQSWFDKSACTPEETAHMWHGGVGQAWREEVTTYYSVDVTCELMALLDERAERVADELDVEQIDLPSLLEPSLRSYYDFLHLTPAGARAVARAVLATLVREPLAAGRMHARAGIPACNRSGKEMAS